MARIRKHVFKRFHDPVLKRSHKVAASASCCKVNAVVAACSPSSTRQHLFLFHNCAELLPVFHDNDRVRNFHDPAFQAIHSTGLGKLRTGSWAMARGEAPGRWRGTECSRRQQTTETGELTGMQHAVTMHDEAGEAAEGRTLRCCRSTRAQTPPKKPVEQWWLPSILSRLAQALPVV